MGEICDDFHQLCMSMLSKIKDWTGFVNLYSKFITFTAATCKNTVTSLVLTVLALYITHFCVSLVKIKLSFLVCEVLLV